MNKKCVENKYMFDALNKKVHVTRSTNSGSNRMKRYIISKSSMPRYKLNEWMNNIK